MSLTVYLAKEDNLVVYNPTTEYLLYIRNAEEPDKLPTTGLLELCQVYGKKVGPDSAFDQFLVNYIRKDEDRSVGGFPLLGRICRDLDTYDLDEIENHLIILGDESQAEELVESLDLMNEEGFHTLGPYTYNTEFNRIVFQENSEP